MVRVTQLEPLRFVGYASPGPFERIFGGQLVGQAVMAAALTVDTNRAAHSFHCSFMRKGNLADPIQYSVELLRDGRAFSLRGVRATQNNRLLMIASVSFQEEAAGIEHMLQMEDVARPPDVNFAAERNGGSEKAFAPPHRRGIEIHPVPESAPSAPERNGHHRLLWFRMTKRVQIDDPQVRRAVLALCSDFTFLEVAIRGHNLTFADPSVSAASLDHSFWWHEDPHLNGWMLYQQSSPWAGGQRGLVLGHIFDQTGSLLGTATQEGLVRIG